MNRRKRKHANVPCISLTLNAKMLFELSAQILSRLTIALRARSPDSISPGVIASVSEAIQEKRSHNGVRDDRFLHILSATCHRGRRSLSAIYGLLRRKAPRNDVKSAALSLAARKDFVSKANKTHVHLVRAMPQAAQKTFACFSLLVRFLFLLRK